MKMRSLILPALLALAFGTISTTAASAQSAVGVSPDEFASLRWLEGRWVGSGGEYEAFYEEFRFVDEGTIEQVTFTDSTFSTQSSRSLIQHTGGMVVKSNDDSRSVVTDIDDESLRFERVGKNLPGFTWTRVSDDQWYAVLDRPGEGPMVYNMRRLSEAR